jgi:hypothetical protein
VRNVSFTLPLIRRSAGNGGEHVLNLISIGYVKTAPAWRIDGILAVSSVVLAQPLLGTSA